MENEVLEVTEKKAEVGTMDAFANTEAFNNLYRMGNLLSESNIVPAAYQKKPTDCAVAIDMANRMGVSPLFVMQNLFVVKGKPSWSGQACMSMIKASPEFEHVKPVYTGQRGTDSWGCYIEAVRKEDGEKIAGTEVTIKMAKDEGWYEKPGSKWKTMPEQMLAYRAAAFFSRVHIPNALMGCAVEGEVEDTRNVPVERPKDPFSIGGNTDAVDGK